MLFGLTTVRLILFLKPDVLQAVQPWNRSKLKEAVDVIVWAGVGALLLIHFVVRSFYIPSGSMMPTLQVNDYILVNEFLFEFTDPRRGDIVVFRPPLAYSGEKTDLIKRVVGLENDKIEVKKGQLHVNDVPIQENFILEPMLGNFEAQIVKKGHVFVMGDNRNDSRDSRAIGQIPLKNLVGRADFIFFPPSRITNLNISR